MQPIRIGIIGLGNIGNFHADYLLNGKVENAVLAAVCSSSPEKRARFQASGVAAFSDAAAMFQSRSVDAVLIATPHYQHVELGLAAFAQGLHVLVEKPIAAHKADAERLIAAHAQKPELVFAGMFQLRAEPRYAKIRELIRSGELGQLVRVNWISTDWFRTEAYYNSSAWRATWRGEGGGVLLNQCLHHLDTLQWLCGQPQRVRGFCQFGRYHQIEVEDNVTAYLEWANGATGTFIGSSGEAPGTNRLEITGTRGRIVLEEDRLRFTRNATDMQEFSRTVPQGFRKPEAEVLDIAVAAGDKPHAVVTQNFVNAIRHGEPLLAPGADGLHSLELANGIVHSALREQTLSLPLDGAAWAEQLGELITNSVAKKKAAQTTADDVASSFRR